MKTPAPTTVRVPGIEEAYRKRLETPEESITEPLQLWLPCVSGPPDTETVKPKKRTTR